MAKKKKPARKCPQGYHWNSSVGRCVKNKTKRHEEIQEAFKYPKRRKKKK